MRRFLLEAERICGAGAADKCRGEYSSMSHRPQMKTSPGPHLVFTSRGWPPGALTACRLVYSRAERGRRTIGADGYLNERSNCDIRLHVKCGTRNITSPLRITFVHSHLFFPAGGKSRMELARDNLTCIIRARIYFYILEKLIIFKLCNPQVL